MSEQVFVLRIRRWHLLSAMALVAVLAIAAFGIPTVNAQKVQEEFDDKFKVGTEDGGISIATSADGKYVYVAGQKGVLVSDDHGKTGSWVQTVRMK